MFYLRGAVSNRDSMYAKQALYLLSHIPSQPKDILLLEFSLPSFLC